MSIKGDVEELNKINNEIKRVLGSIKKLRVTKKELEKRVQDYLKEKDIPGVKYQDLVIQLNTTPKKVLKKKAERDRDIFNVLTHFGIQNPNDLLEKLKNAGKETKSSESIKIIHTNV